MTEYIYIVKCDGCEDEIFNFFTDARMQCDLVMSKHPSIQQIEIERNDFGECTNHCDLGTVWSWEEAMQDIPTEPQETVFSKAETFGCKCGGDCKCEPGTCKCDHSHDTELEDDDFFAVTEDFPLDEGLRVSFDNKEDQKEFFKLCKETGMHTPADLDRFMKDYEADDSNLLDKLRAYKVELDNVDVDFPVKESCGKAIPEGMSIKDLVEAMEENEDTVECAGCEELFPKDECFHKEGIGYLCSDCEDRVVKCSWCNELYDRSECRREVDLGWLCDRCEAAIKSRGETLTFREGSYWDFLDEDAKTLTEAPAEKVELEYEELTVEVPVDFYKPYYNGNNWEPGGSIDEDVTVSYTYKVDKSDVEEYLMENHISDEYIEVNYPGGVEAFDKADADAQYKLIEDHFDELFEKYHVEILEYFRENAEEAFADNWLEGGYDDYFAEPDYDPYDD